MKIVIECTEDEYAALVCKLSSEDTASIVKALRLHLREYDEFVCKLICDVNGLKK